MEFISNILFYGLTLTLVLSLLFAVLHDEMHQVFYFVLDSITYQVSAIQQLWSR